MPPRMIRRNRAIAVALALGAGALGVSLAVPGGVADGPAALRSHRAAARLTAGEDTPALGSAPLRLISDQGLRVATVRIKARAAGIAVPRSFFGLSTEYWGLPRYEGEMALFERILDDLRVRGGGPLIIRVGGGSADHSYWEPIDRVMPGGAFEVKPSWFQRTRTLVSSSHLHLILDLNLVARSPAMAAEWAAAATAALPRGTITGFEIGNEPDLYHRFAWYQPALTARRGFLGPVRLPHFSADNYVSGFRSYARALAVVARGAPILGPAVANPSLDVGWISRLLASQRAAVGMITAHRYPFSQCAVPWSPLHATVARVLSERASAGMARSVKAAVGLAHRAGLRFRLTEMNSVTCGGTAGVSDTFATALWAPDALFELLRDRVDGVNLHIRPDPINAPFVLAGSHIQVRPLLYGMILFAHTLGPGARLLPTSMQHQRGLHLKVWAVRLAGHRARVLVINKGGRAAQVDLRLPAVAPATVERLLAPSVSARSGASMAGQRIDGNGVWHGARVVERLARGAHGYRLTMPAASAALVSVPLAPLHSAHHLRRGRKHRPAHRR